MKREIMTAGAFLGPLLLLSVLSAVLTQKVFSEEENRYLAAKPVFTWETFLDGSFGTSYETWLSDQFPLRGTFVAAKTNADRLILREDVNGVYFGTDNYYIEKTDSEELLTNRLAENIDFLSQAAGTYSSLVGEDRVKIMLVPSASQILTDKLPAFASPADQRIVFELARKKLEETTGRDDMLLDVENTLRTAWEEERRLAEVFRKPEEPLYYHTDHHWTSLGAYYAYRLYGQAAGLDPWEREQFREEIVTSDFLGTIQSKLGVNLPPDDITLFIPKQPTAVSVYYDGMAEASDSLYNEAALDKKDKYSIFLDGNHGLTQIINENPGAGSEGRRLMIVKDSYAHSFAPFAVNHFEEIDMIDLRYFNMKPSEFAKNREITDILILYQIPGFAKDGNLFKMAR